MSTHKGLTQDIASSADACMEKTPERTPSTEFVAIEDGSVVKHQRTSLEWQRCAVGQTWNGNSNLCQGKPKIYSWNIASRFKAGSANEWRLPSGEELLSIVETCRAAPAINPQVFPNTPPALFWTSSQDTSGMERVWSVSFFSGSYYRAGKAQNGRVRLVRGQMTMNPDQP